jgi:hypothetical protein
VALQSSPLASGRIVTDVSVCALLWERMSDVAPQPVDWVWPGHIARGKLTGIGKSQIGIDGAARITRRSEFPDGNRAPLNPDFVNVDLTAGKKFGKWQVAWVGFYSTDVSTPVPGYLKQSQFAMDGLLGYDFGPLVLQGWLTSDVYERNYGGHDIRGWTRIVLPLENVFGPPAPAPMVRRY